MTAMNLHLPQIRLPAAGDRAPLPGAMFLSNLAEEILQVLKGAVAPVDAARTELGDGISDDLGLR